MALLPADTAEWDLQFKLAIRKLLLIIVNMPFPFRTRNIALTCLREFINNAGQCGNNIEQKAAHYSTNYTCTYLKLTYR